MIAGRVPNPRASWIYSKLFIYNDMPEVQGGRTMGAPQGFRWFSRSTWWISTTASITGAPRHVFRYIIAVMSQEASDLLKKALNLPVAERAELAGSLIESLDETDDESVQAAWDIEIVRRMEDLNSGKVKPVSLEEARRRFSSAIE